MVQTIKINDDNNYVKIAQYLAGFADIGQATSLFDVAFEDFIKNYQQSKNIEITGIVDEATWAQLRANAPTLKIGIKNAAVCALQLLLEGLNVDGDFGARTKQAVIAYQSSNKLSADGIVGQKTWTQLLTIETAATTETTITLPTEDTPESIKLQKGDDRTLVQIAKYLIGYAKVGQASTAFDDNFEQAVKKYQNKYNLSADGIIGNNTWTVIKDHAITISASQNNDCPAVCALQLFLGNLTVDGRFGSQTKSAVLKYQREHNLTADGIVGKKTWSCLIFGEEKEKPVVPPAPMDKPVDYKQYDTRWKNVMYSNHNDYHQTISSGGCGPTAMADIIATWWDASITPVETCKWACQWGDRTYNNGTGATFFKRCAEKYKPSKYVHWTTSMDNLIACLQDGGLAIVCFNNNLNNRWTTGGHYCCIYAYDGEYFYINDPASTKANRLKGEYSAVKTCRKGFCLFWR